MALEFWMTLWKAVFVIGVGLFAALAVVVAVGGARDIAKLLRILRSQRVDEGNDSVQRASGRPMPPTSQRKVR